MLSNAISSAFSVLTMILSNIFYGSRNSSAVTDMDFMADNYSTTGKILHSRKSILKETFFVEFTWWMKLENL